MALEAELVYRAQDSGGRKDAAYVIQLVTGELSLVEKCYQVVFKWGSWECYRNAKLTPKTAYVGGSLDTARREIWGAADKRLDRGYELQTHLSTIPPWLSAHADYASRYGRASVPPQQAVAAVHTAPPPPEPLPAGRVKHTRAGFIEL